ncbi:hypothetical protein H2200_003095 [Cladophialophora chaetospira]|uniref:DhaK domain-containing protein n=1 Tax=Cladophialophora chaetospira TaxID=386627 RepID=A0AA38XGT0_9EURO|nr:hypothetical protein H2200_003095 [Cladophialophora chaetospira]
MEIQTPSFLNLPAHYNTKVSDMVQFTFTSSNSNLEPSNSALKETTRSTGPGTLLISKIVDGLINWGGYDEHDIAKVGGLVARNVYSCHSRQVQGEVQGFMTSRSGKEEDEGKGDAKDVPSLAVEFMLRGLLDRTVSPHVHINSNEPVMFINFDDGENGCVTTKQRDMLNYITDIAVTEAQDRWGICPVRVYAGKFIPGEKGASEGEEEGHAVPSFSLTLLNVVNTDIGGPSMPQLLDAPCHAAEWTRMLRKEVWRGLELVSREENADLVEAHIADDASEHSFGSADDDESIGSDADRLLVGSEDVERRGGDIHESETGDGEDNEVQQEASTIDQHQQNEIPTSPQLSDRPETAHGKEKSPEPDHPKEWTDEEEDVAQEIELPERHIKHPSWDRHDDSTSLLDLIRSQASVIAPFGTGTAGHGVPDLEGNVGGAVPAKTGSEDRGARKEGEAGARQEEPAETKSKSSSEDDFVVV